ncbi:hypothetical protein ACVW0J_006079 [Bradyrhizobium sp. i1.7.7]
MAIVGAFQRRPANVFDTDLGDAIAFEFKEFSGFVRDVDQPVAVIGPAVVDAHDQRFAVRDIGHPRIGRHRQGRMRRCQRGHVEHFAIGGQAAVEIVAVPGRHTLGAVVDVLLRHVGPAAHNIGLADAVGAAAFRNRIPKRHDQRGLEDTPYFGSTRLANLFEEAQLASARQVATAATPRAARKTESDRRIPMRPKYHFAGGVPNPLWLRGSAVRSQNPRRPTTASEAVRITQPEHGGNGEPTAFTPGW